MDSGGGRHELDVALRPAAAAEAEFVSLPLSVPQEKRTPEGWRKCSRTPKKRGSEWHKRWTIVDALMSSQMLLQD